MSSIAIIGGGSSSLILAEMLGNHFKVALYEKGKTIGRKYLVAGKGGFNISNNLTGKPLNSKYTPVGFLDKALNEFGVSELRDWYKKIGVETFIGSSNRVFPKEGISPADVLRSIKKQLSEKKVIIHTQSEFVGFNKDGLPLIKNAQETESVKSDYYVFCLGGGSWKVTGSNSDWLDYFNKIGITTTPFESSNCGLNINWNDRILKNHEGKPLKNISVTCGVTTIKGEALITQYGIEGNAIYPISALVREYFKHSKIVTIILDFKPNLTELELLKKIKGVKPSNYGKALKLDTASMAIIKNETTKEAYLNPELFVKKVKHLELQIECLRPIEESISTVGGIIIENLNPNFSLKSKSNMFCIGEMVNWDAPTGGFLLQACFSMANLVAQTLIHKKKAD
ncbi:MAG: TIGR03862 family flavoprotein [Salibacteraceae bacterium]